MAKVKTYKIDEYGIKEWHPGFKILLGLIVLYAYIAIVSFPLYYAEAGEPGANVNTYRDAFWLLQMAASTIGFGDVYPTTEVGRAIVAISFYIGMGIAGFIAGTAAQWALGKLDNSVQNRELRKQNEEILKLLKEKL